MVGGSLAYGLGVPFLLGSCEKKNPKQLPARLSWDRQSCARCAMAISDRRYAAQLVKADGKAYFFDDIGCALQFLEAREWKDAPSCPLWGPRGSLFWIHFEAEGQLCSWPTHCKTRS